MASARCTILTEPVRLVKQHLKGDPEGWDTLDNGDIPPPPVLAVSLPAAVVGVAVGFNSEQAVNEQIQMSHPGDPDLQLDRVPGFLQQVSRHRFDDGPGLRADRATKSLRPFSRTAGNRSRKAGSWMSPFLTADSEMASPSRGARQRNDWHTMSRGVSGILLRCTMQPGTGLPWDAARCVLSGRLTTHKPAALAAETHPRTAWWRAA